MELVDSLERGEPLSRPGVVVTFDDGTEDHFTYAFPVLRQYRIPATIFMITEGIGRPGFLNLEQIRIMSQEGISFGSHTLRHAYLPSLPMDRVKDELQLSRRRLEEMGLSVEALSYPGGGYTEDVIRQVQEAGYRAACTTNRGTERFPPNRWALRRISMHRGASSSLGMWIRCCGLHGINHRLRAPA